MPLSTQFRSHRAFKVDPRNGCHDVLFCDDLLSTSAALGICRELFLQTFKCKNGKYLKNNLFFNGKFKY